MKGNMKKVITLVMALVLVLSITSVLVSAATATKTIEKIKGVWTYTVNGKADYSFTGFASNANGTYYVEKGIVTFKTTSVIKAANGKDWFNVVNSKVTAGPTIAHNSNGWWYIDKNGQVDFTFDGLAKNQNGIYWCDNGKVTFKANGAAKYEGTWYPIVKSKMSATFTGFGKDLAGSGTTVYFVKGEQSSLISIIHNDVDGKWYGVVNGIVVTYREGDFGRYGRPMMNNVNGWYAIAPNGTVDFTYTGVAFREFSFMNGKLERAENAYIYAIKNGKFNSALNGVVKISYRSSSTTAWANFKNGVVQKGVTIAHNSNGWWYIDANGFVDFSYTGLATNQNGTYFCENGKVKFDKNGAYKTENSYVALVNSKVNWAYSGPLKDIETGKQISFIDGRPEYADGLYKDTDGKWKYFVNGEVYKSASPFLAANYNGIYYVNTDGLVDFNFTGFYLVEEDDYGFDEDEIVYINAGKWDETKTDIMSVDLAQVFSGSAYKTALLEEIKDEFDIKGESFATANVVVKAYVENGVVYAADGEEIVLDAKGAEWLIEEVDFEGVYNTVKLDMDATEADKAPVYYTGVVTFDDVKYNVTDGKIANSNYTGFVYDNGAVKYYKDGKFDATKTDIMDIDLFQIEGLSTKYVLSKLVEEPYALDEKTSSLVLKAYVKNGLVYTDVANGEEIVKDAKGAEWLIEKASADGIKFNTVKLNVKATIAAKAPVYYTGSTLVTTATNITSKYVVNGAIDANYTGFYYDYNIAKEVGQIKYMSNGKFDATKTDVMDIDLLKIIPTDIIDKALDYLASDEGQEMIAEISNGYTVDASILDKIVSNLTIKSYVENGVVYFNEDAWDDGDALIAEDANKDAWIIECGKGDTTKSGVGDSYYKNLKTYFPELCDLGIQGNIVWVDAYTTAKTLAPAYFTGIAYAHGTVIDLSKVIDESYVDSIFNYEGALYYFENGKLVKDANGIVEITEYCYPDSIHLYDEPIVYSVVLKDGAVLAGEYDTKEDEWNYYEGMYTAADGSVWYVVRGKVWTSADAKAADIAIETDKDGKDIGYFLKGADLFYAYEDLAHEGEGTCYRMTAEGKVDTAFYGFDDNGRYYEKGVWATDFTGLVDKTVGDVTEKWYVEKGVAQLPQYLGGTEVIGLFDYNDATWYVFQGKVLTGENAAGLGLLNDKKDNKVVNFYNDVNYIGKDVYVQYAFTAEGKVDTAFTGFDGYGRYYINGVWAHNDDAKLGFTGLVAVTTNDVTEQWYVANGVAQLPEYLGGFEVTGLIKDRDGAIKWVTNGKFDATHSGIGEIYDGTRYVIENGVVNKYVTGVLYGVYYVEGVQAKNANAIIAQEYLSNNYFYVINGVVDTDYTGNFNYSGATYTIVDGVVTLKVVNS